MSKRIVVTKEAGSGRNLIFRDTVTKKNMTRSEFVKQIEKGKYSKYHVRKINNIKTPVSNPDSTTNNNLDWYFLRGLIRIISKSLGVFC